MSDIIHLLPDSVANQIAAGEVIQRPASVIKELVENSVDAGAKRIDVVIADAGKTSIQVIDDGKGMSQTDARLSFERHATSKIREAGDLFALRTMGFRGEALASIAAVAQVELKTRSVNSELGTCITIAGSDVVGQEAISCSVGSQFTVNNLFFNVPARRKFLKSNQTELSNILQEFERIALVNPDIAFSLSHNGNMMFNLPASTSRLRIANIFGKKLNEQLLPVNVATTMVQVSGYVAKPEASRKKGAHQYFFVNGRYMRHPYFHKAVMEAFEQLIPTGEQISYFIYFDVDPANIDVNIHPTKTEIKFENELDIWKIIVAAIKESLGRFNAIPTIDFNVEGRPDIPVFENSNGNLDIPVPQFNPDFNPFKTNFSSSCSSSYATQHKPVMWEELYGDLPQALSQADYLEQGASEDLPTLYKNEDECIETSNLHYQFKGKYILTSVKSGLMIIDQQRAHVRVLFDKYKKQISLRTGTSQRLLFPEIFELPASQAVVLDDIMECIHAIGFEIASLGGGSYSVNGFPADIEGLNPVELIRDMLTSAIEKGSEVQEEIQNQMALSLAHKSAIATGQVLSNEEMDALISELFACEIPNFTPDGKVIISILEQMDLERMFF